MKPKYQLALLTLAFLALAAFVRPNLTPHHNDAFLYLTAADCYLQEGFACAHDREPLFPLFLALLKLSGLSLGLFLPLAQNLLFLFSLFFLTGALRQREPLSKNARFALAVALIPTFLITMNGAAYTEAISASFVCVLIGAAIRLVAGNDQSSKKSAAFQAGLVLVAALLLDLTKGSFAYIHLLFALSLLPLLLRKNLPRGRVAVLAGVLALSSVLHMAQGRVYGRGGAVLFGRAEYARRFDFSEQSLPYLVNALSESACARIYGDHCRTVAFGAENILGNSRAEAGESDAVLLKEGAALLLANPLRQGFFVLFEWAKLLLHHGTAGFARLEAPLLGDLVHSTIATILLKLANMALLLVFAREFFRLARALFAFPTAELPLYACLCYLLAYLFVYGIVTTVIRMAYPVAPLLLLFCLVSVQRQPLQWPRRMAA